MNKLTTKPRLTLPLMIGILVIASQSSLAEDDTGSRSPELKRPVILLTGFESFGTDLPPNPSWKGIQKLNGVKWKEFELIAKEMPVVWGSPLDTLSKWIGEFRPIAVLSLGQGDANEFRIESVAQNRRGNIPDNLGTAPPHPDVIEKGPQYLKATVDCNRMSKALSAAGYPTRVSKDAGKYLCEETLYTLEYLRQNTKGEMMVLFCHVPPIGSEVGTNKVDAQYIQKFVMHALEEVRSIAIETKAEANSAEALVRRYFKVWSDQDMQAYGDCFSKHASIHSVEPNGNMSLSALRPFVEGQTRAHKNATSRMVEVPEEIVIRNEGRLMRAIVKWKLTAENRVTTGYDHFTLCKEMGKWKIVNLVFYESD